MLKKTTISFPGVFEVLIWVFYVCFYKYSYYVDQFHFHPDHPQNFPFPQVGLYCLCSTLYLIPYYRWAVPKLLYAKKYGWLILLSIVYFVLLTTWNNVAIAWVFKLFTGGVLQRFFIIQSAGFYIDWNMIMTDAIAFLCIAFSRFSYQSEQQRHKAETAHLQLQLTMLKSQLQPHFLFNTLNSLYGMSLSGSKNTSRFILLLSQMMQYILYECDYDKVALDNEADFLKGYFEIEQTRFPKSKIEMTVSDTIPSLKVPPLLFLPLVENSFKHGKHKLEDNATVTAALYMENSKLIFTIKNDMLPVSPLPLSKQPGGIGLVNIKKRLELYYPGKHQLELKEENNFYIAQLSVIL